MLYIYTVCYSTPLFIEPQYKLLRKYIKNEFEYIIFNNTMTNTAISQRDIDNNNILQDVCKKHNIKVFNLPRDLFHGISDSNASIRAGTAINFAHRLLFSNYSLDSSFFLIDSDAFLINDFDVEKFMENKNISGRIQYRKGATNTIKYITNHVVIFKPNKFDKNLFLKYFSFLPCNIDNVGCDCGGNINFLFNEIGDDDFINWTNKLFSKSGNSKQQWGGPGPNSEKDFNIQALNSINNSKLKNYILQDTSILKKNFPFCEIFENTNNNTIFLHMRAGTNWINYNIENRNKVLFNFLNEITVNIFGKQTTHN